MEDIIRLLASNTDAFNELIAYFESERDVALDTCRGLAVNALMDASVRSMALRKLGAVDELESIISTLNHHKLGAKK